MFYGSNIPKILIVDDSRESLTIIENMLQTLEVDIVSTSSAAEALLKTNSQSFAFGLIDIRMDNLDGLELSEILRTNENTRELPIIFISSIQKKNDPLLGRIEEIGGDFINKPIIPEILRGKAKYLIELYKSKMALTEQAQKYNKIIKKMTSLSVNLEREIDEIKSNNLGMPTINEISQQQNQIQQKIINRMEKEINLPTTNILTLSNLLMESKLNQEQLDYTKRIDSISEWLLTSTNDILDYPRISSNNIELHINNFNLEKIISTVVKILEPKAKEKGLQFNCKISPTVPPNLRGDSTRIIQIIRNLALNAIQNTKTGSVNITVDLQDESKDRCTLYFEVKDTGYGMEMTEMNKLLATNGHRAIKPEDSIGMTIIKSLVNLMGGSVGARSKVSQGSQFWFTINLKKGTQK